MLPSNRFGVQAFPSCSGEVLRLLREECAGCKPNQAYSVAYDGSKVGSCLPPSGDSGVNICISIREYCKHIKWVVSLCKTDVFKFELILFHNNNVHVREAIHVCVQI